MMKGSGIKKRGGNIVFFNDVKQILKKRVNNRRNISR